MTSPKPRVRALLMQVVQRTICVRQSSPLQSDLSVWMGLWI